MYAIANWVSAQRGGQSQSEQTMPTASFMDRKMSELKFGPRLVFIVGRWWRSEAHAARVVALVV